MDELSLTNSTIKSKIVWHQLLPNLRCTQVPLTEVFSVLDLYPFDTISSGGGNLSEGYTILSQDCADRGRLCDRDVKSITLVDEDAAQVSISKLAYVEYLGCSTQNGCRKGKCNWKGRIAVFWDKPLNLYNIECHGSQDPEHVRKKPYRMAKVIRKEITSRSTNITPSILATEFMNNAKISSTLANQVQPVSTRFTPNLEAIQNALKYDKKLHHPSALEFEKQFGIKDSKDPKEQAVLLGIASTIMPKLLTKYPDLFAVDSTSHHNCLKFPNTAFIVRSDEPRGRIIATFVNNRETIPVVDLMFESLTMDKWDPYLTAAKKHFPNTQPILCDWHETDALKEWFTKNLNDQWIRDRVFYQFRFVKRSRDQEEFNQRKATLLNVEKLQTAIGNLTLDAARIITSYF
ncbi:hypothetical protein C2G38_2151045 [Gigaspora rosea]|uniref:Uncharacterized protein n=1 Tax=Gigaspora rosea TaxID=44941 RepID=A0A397W8C7_9GLOM|nr:hypothetical protein C2G38_2151045 [Gigaspora rosea]